MKYISRGEYDKTVIVDSEMCCTYWGEIQYYILLEYNAGNSGKLGLTSCMILTDRFFRVCRSSRQVMLPPMLRTKNTNTHTQQMPTQAHSNQK